MFAIIRTGGKQYKVQKDDVIQVDKLDAEKGKSVDISDVLFLSDGKKATMGKDLKGASVKAEILEQKKDKKIVVFKKKRRQNYRRKKGHRQDVTILKVTDIKAA